MFVLCLRTQAHHSISQVVKVPVLPYVKKVLIKWHGKEPLSLSDRSLPAKSVYAIPVDQCKQESIPGETLEIYLSDRVAPYYKKFEPAFQLGLYFEKVVQRMMLTHMIAQRRCGRNAKAALEDFLMFYNIDEEEYSWEAGYMLWRKRGKGIFEQKIVRS